MTLALKVYVPTTGAAQDKTPLAVEVMPAGVADVFQVSVLEFGFVEVSVALKAVPPASIPRSVGSR